MINTYIYENGIIVDALLNKSNRIEILNLIEEKGYDLHKMFYRFNLKEKQTLFMYDKMYDSKCVEDLIRYPAGVPCYEDICNVHNQISKIEKEFSIEIYNKFEQFIRDYIIDFKLGKYLKIVFHEEASRDPTQLEFLTYVLNAFWQVGIIPQIKTNCGH